MNPIILAEEKFYILLQAVHNTYCVIRLANNAYHLYITQNLHYNYNLRLPYFYFKYGCPLAQFVRDNNSGQVIWKKGCII